MSTTWTPPRYPAGHPQAGRIIVDPEAEALERMDLMSPQPAPEQAKPAPATAAPTPPGGTPRTLSSLLPGGEASQDAQPAQRPGIEAAASLVALALALVAIWAVTRPLATPAPTTAAPTAAPTVQATPAATSEPAVTALPPDAAPRALVAYFDYQDAGSAVAIENGVRYQIVGRAGSRWLLITTEAGARVWALAEDLGVTVDPDLPDLSPPLPPAPAAPARPVAPAAPVLCTDATAPFRATIEVPPGPKPSDIGGIAGGWSCVSQEDALAKAEQNAALIRAKWSTP